MRAIRQRSKFRATDSAETSNSSVIYTAGMRILICNTFLYPRGGAETYTLTLADLLRRHGHEVLFFCMQHPENRPCDQSRYFVDYIDFPTIHREVSAGAAWKVMSRSIYYFEARKRIRGLLESERPDVVHLQNLHAHLTPSIIDEVRSARIPIVWTLHDFKLLCPEHSFYANGRVCEQCKGGRFYRCTVNRCKKDSFSASLVASLEAYVHSALGVCRRVDRFVAPSRFLKSKFEEFGWDGSRIEFVRNCLAELGEPHPGGKGYGVYTGMLRPTKGIGTLLRALAKAGDPPFYLAGDGPIRAELEAEARELGLKNAAFLGHLDKARLATLVEDADYAVVASEWYENCPYAIMELMAAAKPVIASNHGGMAELVEHGRTGMVFDVGDADQLAACVRVLVEEPEVGRRWGESGRARAEREFAPEAHYDRLMELYRKVLGAAAAGAAQSSA